MKCQSHKPFITIELNEAIPFHCTLQVSKIITITKTKTCSEVPVMENMLHKVPSLEYPLFIEFTVSSSGVNLIYYIIDCSDTWHHLGLLGISQNIHLDNWMLNAFKNPLCTRQSNALEDWMFKWDSEMSWVRKALKKEEGSTGEGKVLQLKVQKQGHKVYIKRN